MFQLWGLKQCALEEKSFLAQDIRCIDENLTSEMAELDVLLSLCSPCDPMRVHYRWQVHEKRRELLQINFSQKSPKRFRYYQGWTEVVGVWMVARVT